MMSTTLPRAPLHKVDVSSTEGEDQLDNDLDGLFKDFFTPTKQPRKVPCKPSRSASTAKLSPPARRLRVKTPEKAVVIRASEIDKLVMADPNPLPVHEEEYRSWKRPAAASPATAKRRRLADEDNQ